MDGPDEASQKVADQLPSQPGAPGPWQQPGPPGGWAPPQPPYPYWQGYSATQQPRRSNTPIIVAVVVAILLIVVVVPVLALMLLSGQLANLLSSIGQNLNSPPP